MSKAERIRSLNDGVRSNSQIAALCDCRPEYVRVVLRQRVPERKIGALHEIEHRYAMRRFGNLKAYYRYRNQARLSPWT